MSAKFGLRRFLSLLGLGLTLAASFVPALGQDGIATVAVKRYFLARITARCHLLDAGAVQALKAGYLQARNDALRAGASMADMAPWLAKAAAAADQSSCAAPLVTAEVDRAKSAYLRFMAVPHLDLPTPRSQWSADRSFADTETWRLVQYQASPEADLAIGIFGRLDVNSLSVMAHFQDNQRPYSARLLVRDPDIVRIGLINPQPFGLSSQRPDGIDATSLSFMATTITDDEAVVKAPVKANMAGFSLTGNYVGTQTPVQALRFDFPKRAFIALARLDPREDIVVEFDFQEGPRYARFEVGDFVAGLTYVAMPSPYFHN